MRATLRLPRRASYVEYLAVERASPLRHELLDGVIVAMAGGTPEHNALSSRLALVMGQRLSRPCQHFSPDQRYWIPSSERARYADGSVICGRPARAPQDPHACTNPVIVTEVLSPSTEGDDEGDKRVDFQSLASLEAYVLVDQDERRVRVYRRQGGGWPKEPETYASGDALSLPHLERPIPVDEIYLDILDDAGRSLLS